MDAQRGPEVENAALKLRCAVTAFHEPALYPEWQLLVGRDAVDDQSVAEHHCALPSPRRLVDSSCQHGVISIRGVGVKVPSASIVSISW